MIFLQVTKMHSSRMRAIRLLPVSPSMHCSWGVPARGCTCLGGVPVQGGVPACGVYLPGGWGCTCPGGCTSPGRCTCLGGGGVPAQRGCTCLGVYLPRGYLPRYSPHPCGQTDTCKNITFANFVCRR